jgi:hypothetical protein
MVEIIVQIFPPDFIMCCLKVHCTRFCYTFPSIRTYVQIHTRNTYVRTHLKPAFPLHAYIHTYTHIHTWSCLHLHWALRRDRPTEASCVWQTGVCCLYAVCVVKWLTSPGPMNFQHFCTEKSSHWKSHVATKTPCQNISERNSLTYMHIHKQTDMIILNATFWYGVLVATRLRSVDCVWALNANANSLAYMHIHTNKQTWSSAMLPSLLIHTHTYTYVDTFIHTHKETNRPDHPRCCLLSLYIHTHTYVDTFIHAHKETNRPDHPQCCLLSSYINT